MENDTNVYKEEDFSDKDSYQKKRPVEFVNNLGYFGGGVPLIEADKKCLKRLIDVWLLIGPRSCEDRQIAFGKFEIYSILLMLVCPFSACLDKIIFFVYVMKDEVRVWILK